MAPDLTSIELFLKTVKLGNLSRAAEQSHLSLSAASRRLSLLEQHFKVVLLHRSSTGVSPTAAGEVLAEHGLSILRAVDVMHADLADYAKGATGRVCLYANSSAMSQQLPSQLTQWNALHPGIRLDIREERSREILQAVRDGVADVGIVTTQPGGDELRFIPYCQDRLCLLVPDDHPFKMRHARFADLLGYDFVGLEDNAAITALITEAAAAIGMPLRLRVQVRSFEAVCRLIAAGQGVGVLPQGAVQIFRKEMALRFIEIDDPWADRQMYLCMRQQQPSPTSLALFDYLAACHRA
ncbi:transcriptional regulator, LysR family [Pseudomonas fluorescens]|uniref:Transcriptional regulator, LysR family n=1 Tax=Pseudomonas fluorescens TaxID=294 RepID=A0A379IBR3_PSEFL|nr:LysR family transcriptional regulator [Pseudomonas fluorescens]AIG00654.1 LysR family transcriptional regulator [Pseudomonas fluorescens]SUD30315.1 transcriptional regulator, LysR family [Pseudomonas fluorescens]